MGARAETLARLEAADAEAAALPPGAERLKLALAIEEQRAKLRRGWGDTALEWIRSVGAVAVAGGAVFALIKGVYEYAGAARQRDEAVFLEALSSISDDASPAKRAGALVTIGKYSERDQFSDPDEEDYTDAQRAGVVLGLQVLDEQAPALRDVMLDLIGDDSSMTQTALYVLAISNHALWRDLGYSSGDPPRDDLPRQLRSSAWAIGVLLHELPEGETVKGALDISDVSRDDGTTLFLGGADLSGLDFREVEFVRTSFSESDVENADFGNASLDTTTMRSLCTAAGVDRTRFSTEQYTTLTSMCPQPQPEQ